ncbi:MAG TPA: helix-turn-helix domain-containing protein [Planctomycetaceae bacterium]
MPIVANEPAITDPLRTVSFVSRQTAMPPSTIYQLIERQVIPAVRLAGSGSRDIIRVRQSALDAYINRGAGQ